MEHAKNTELFFLSYWAVANGDYRQSENRFPWGLYFTLHVETNFQAVCFSWRVTKVEINSNRGLWKRKSTNCETNHRSSYYSRQTFENSFEAVDCFTKSFNSCSTVDQAQEKCRTLKLLETPKTLGKSRLSLYLWKLRKWLLKQHCLNLRMIITNPLNRNL